MFSLLACAQPPGYVDAKQCGTCHASIYASYQKTGMARSFSRAAAADTIADFFHPASDSHYSMSVRDGRYVQTRWQIGFDQKKFNVEEMPVDYIMGSGNHARTYLSRKPDGSLVELPLSWYAENGGGWGMSPGYDTDHPPSHRLIAYECMACHNSYPSVVQGHDMPGAKPAYAGTLPEGIDCQRCHGPGAKHVAAPAKDNIVNPSRLAKDRQMEVCMQCHLEPSSAALPSLIRRFERGPFSYVPGQPLSNFLLAFDHAAGSGYDDKFEIAGGAYRFRQSQCFLKSQGAMTCTTCHNPHDIPRGEVAKTYYAGVCRQCHAGAIDKLVAAGGHPANPDCVSCHMPKRPADDAVHVAITDHLISRRPITRDLPAMVKEYRGDVVPYYPAKLDGGGDDALYLALAQVQQGSNLSKGITQLTAALKATPRADFYKALGDAWMSSGQPGKAADAYRQAASLETVSARNSLYLGMALRASGQLDRAAEALGKARDLDPEASPVWSELGHLAADQRHSADAIAAFRKALALDADRPDVWNALAVQLISGGDAAGAEDAWRKAILNEPAYATAHGNLARLLADRGQLAEAVYYFGKAAALQPSGVGYYEYALTLAKLQRFDESRRAAELAVKTDAGMAEAHHLLGALLARAKDADEALVEYREAVRLKPAFSRAQLDLGVALRARGDTAGAVLHLREAGKSGDPAIAGQAVNVLKQIETGR